MARIEDTIVQKNMAGIKENAYPGRGIVMGMTPDGTGIIQVYWIMGRSENSRNRIFEIQQGNVRTRAFDESKMTDPSLIIYYPVRSYGDKHIVTNGDQTDTIYDCFTTQKTFQDAIASRTFEPDPPNYTPRISGCYDNGERAYVLSIIKSIRDMEEHKQTNVYTYDNPMPGIGHCIHTYRGDGNPLPSFSGEPYETATFNTVEENLEHYWSLLNEENRISLLVKKIIIETNEVKLKIMNKLR